MRAASLLVLLSLTTACGGPPADLVLRLGGDECRSNDDECPTFDLGAFAVSGDLEKRLKVVNEGGEPGRVFSAFFEQERQRFTLANQFFGSAELKGGEEIDVVVRVSQGARAFARLHIEWETIGFLGSGGGFRTITMDMAAGE